jgi:Calpain family cysteine protease.
MWLGTLLMTSTKQQIIEKIFVNVDYFDKGFVCFQFFKNGEWKQVFIDTLLPYDPQSKQLL